MKICKNCGAQMQDQAAFCTQCGAKTEEQQNGGNGQATGAGQSMGAGQNTSAQGAGQGMTGGIPNPGTQNMGNMNNGAYQQQYYAPVDPYDHTAEFSPKDISDNKVIAMLVYLMGAVGIIIALLASSESPYVSFHVRQGLKFVVLDILAGIVGTVLFFTIIVPIVAGIFIFILWICKIITFFSICGGNAKEPPIVRSFNFLK